MKQNKRNFDKEIIIDKPSIDSKTRNSTELILCVSGWILWFVLITPFPLFIKFCFIILGIYIILRGWGGDNAYRFRKKDKRKHTPNADDKTMADFFQTSPEKIKNIKHCRHIEMFFSDEGKITLESPDLNSPLQILFDPHKDRTSK